MWFQADTLLKLSPVTEHDQLCEPPLFSALLLEPNKSLFDRMAEYQISSPAVYLAPLECDLSCPSARRGDNESAS